MLVEVDKFTVSFVMSLVLSFTTNLVLAYATPFSELKGKHTIGISQMTVLEQLANFFV